MLYLSDVPEIEQEGAGPRINGHEFARFVHHLEASDAFVFLKNRQKPRIRVYLHAGRAHGFGSEIVLVYPELTRPTFEQVTLQPHALCQLLSNLHSQLMHCLSILFYYLSAQNSCLIKSELSIF